MSVPTEMVHAYLLQNTLSVFANHAWALIFANDSGVINCISVVNLTWYLSSYITQQWNTWERIQPARIVYWSEYNQLGLSMWNDSDNTLIYQD